MVEKKKIDFIQTMSVFSLVEFNNDENKEIEQDSDTKIEIRFLAI